MENLFTAEEAAYFLGVKETTITTWLRNGKLKGTKMGKTWRISKDNLCEFLGTSSLSIERIPSNIHMDIRDNTPMLTHINHTVTFTVRNSLTGNARTFSSQELAIKYSELLGEFFDGNIVMSVVLNELPREDKTGAPTNNHRGGNLRILSNNTTTQGNNGVDWLTTRQVAETLQVTIDTVKLWIKHGKLKATKVGKSWRVNPLDLPTNIKESQ